MNHLETQGKHFFINLKRVVVKGETRGGARQVLSAPWCGCQHCFLTGDHFIITCNCTCVACPSNLCVLHFTKEKKCKGGRGIFGGRENKSFDIHGKYFCLEITTAGFKRLSRSAPGDAQPQRPPLYDHRHPGTRNQTLSF